MNRRGFPESEYRARLARAQSNMVAAGLSALFLTTEPEIRYFTGFLTRFWESPTRPWYLIVPVQGDPIAVIPAIGAHLMGQSWLTNIRTWRAPDYDDDGLTLLAETMRRLSPTGGRVGVPSGMESHLRMPLADWSTLLTWLSDWTFTNDANIMRDLRMVKSSAEIEKIRAACEVADRAFARVPEIARAGVALSDVFRRFQMLCLEEGADWVSYLAGGAGQGGYGDVISPASETPLQPGDVLMLDTGLVLDGYYCDFDRNFAVGDIAPATAQAYDTLRKASAAAFDIARPGTTAAELFHAMDHVVTGGAGGSDAGRLGHGLGMQLTEWPSLIPADHTPCEPGHVLTLEPGITLPGGPSLVHEENIVITQNGAEYLSDPAPAQMVRLDT